MLLIFKNTVLHHILAIRADGFFSCILCPTYMATFCVFCLLKWCQRSLVKYLHQFSLNGYVHGFGHLWNLLFELVKQEIWGFYLENSSAASYLLQRVFHEKSVFKGEESIPWHAQSRGGTYSLDWCAYWEMLHLSILVGRVSLQVNVFQRVFCTRQGCWRLIQAQGTRKVWYGYQLGLLALRLGSTLHSPAFQWKVLQTRFDIL